MSQASLPTNAERSFESLKQSNEHGAEFWSARDLQPLLGYSQWRRFEQAVERAITSCETSGNNPENHFAGAGKMVDLGSGSQRQVVTQTRDKLARERVGDQAQAIRTHEGVGKEVRDAIKRIGGTLPECIPPAEHIKEVEKRLKSATPKLQLDEREAGGLLGDESKSGPKPMTGRTP